MKIEINNKITQEERTRHGVKSSKDCTTKEIIDVYLKSIPQEETREQMEKRIRNFCAGW